MITSALHLVSQANGATTKQSCLDNNYPTDGDPASPGIARGTCATTSGVTKDVESQSPDAAVTYSNIQFGNIGSTYTGAGAGPGTPTGTTTRPGHCQSPPHKPHRDSRRRRAQGQPGILWVQHSCAWCTPR
ncbi:hypothetical protein FRC08_000548 [Ceratobasidium sp. 394]|nr:hypothetical protein FRC08_000548 [Ceratobasidium sp. 394]